MKTVYQVNMIESERGWGQKVDEVIYFKAKAAAIQVASMAVRFANEVCDEETGRK